MYTRYLAQQLGPFEVRLPGSQALLDALLDGGHKLGQAVRELAFADSELTATLVRESSLLGDIRREGVGVGTRDRDSKLLALRRRFLIRSRTHGTACVRDELVRPCRPCAGAPEAEREPDAQNDCCDESAEQDPGDGGHATMLDGCWQVLGMGYRPTAEIPDLEPEGDQRSC